MFHNRFNRGSIAKLLCIALAITGIFAAARTLFAEKSVVNGIVVAGIVIEPNSDGSQERWMPRDDPGGLVSTTVQELGEKKFLNYGNTTSAIIPVVIGNPSEQSKGMIVDVPPRIVTVPLEVFDFGSGTWESEQSKVARSEASIDPVKPEATQAPTGGSKPIPLFMPFVIDDASQLQGPTLMEVPAKMISVPLEVILSPEETNAATESIPGADEVVAQQELGVTEMLPPALGEIAKSSDQPMIRSRGLDAEEPGTAVSDTQGSPGTDVSSLADTESDTEPLKSTGELPIPSPALPANASNHAWWQPIVTHSILEKPTWVAFDMEAILLDTLRSSPRIQSVSSRTSVAIENIVQQNAAFDSSVLFETGVGRLNDPVGNSLTTGGPPRLIDNTLDAKAGLRRITRNGATIDLSQELGLKNSNSNFFIPDRQGDTRLALSLTQPLLDRGGRVYNERLLTQARIDSRVSWEEMRTEVEQRIAEVMTAYWQLYELRCHLLQQKDLLHRAQRIESLIQARQDFDAGRIELAKARQRVARRQDRVVTLEAEVRKQQARIVGLIGSEQLYDPSGGLELIPKEPPNCIPVHIDLRSAVQQGIENRPEIRAATRQLEAAALTIRVTRAELVPQLNAVMDAYLAGLNGDYGVLQSFGDQFSRGGPGLSAALEYEMPQGRRVAKSRVRQAQYRFRQRSEELRETIQTTRAQIETAVANIEAALAFQVTKQQLLETAIVEEAILTRRWEMMATDGNTVGTVLENLLDAQQRRTDAEREWTSAQTQYLTALIDFQRAMGTLLIGSGIQPDQQPGSSEVQFNHPSDGLFPPINYLPKDDRIDQHTEPDARDAKGMIHEIN